MKNIFKSKLFLGLAILAMVFFANTANAYTHAGTLRLGMSGSQVLSLQEKLNVSPQSGYFGYITQRAVMNFQSSNNLPADGVVGPMTGAVLAGNTTSSSGSDAFPLDCNLGMGYSPSMGLPCSHVAGFYPPGCTFSTAYSITTGKPCDGTLASEPQFLIEGCFSSAGYSTTSGKPCSTDIISNSFLSGDAGSLADVKRVFSSLSNIGVPENTSNVSFSGYRLINGNDSDLAIASMKISLKLTSGSASDRLNKYAEAIKISQNGTTVGSALVSSFSENSDVYTRSISLSDAVVYQDQESDFLLKVQTLENIDSAYVDNVWTVTLSEIRYKDGTGISFVDSSTGAIGTDGNTNFYFIPVPNDD
jgi:peptidoglycan hydrolase-like protein with peptidoglycan-binding domain